MNKEQLEKMRTSKGFIAALDQSGGSTPKALELYGVEKTAYSNDEQMFDLVHAMRTRIIKSPAFTSEKILAAILFEMTMDRKIDDKYTADYLYDVKGIVPFLKIDKGLANEVEGVQLMKPIPDLKDTLARARERNVFGTKMRSVIKKADKKGIKAIVDQQFEIGMQIYSEGLVPIIEPEVDIFSPDKAESEAILKEYLLEALNKQPADVNLMFKLSIPTVKNFYKELIENPKTVRVVALSGGYSRNEANNKLENQNGMIASFSRALSEGLNVKQSDSEFDETIKLSIQTIYQASIT